jgi:hypothetical protein
MLLRLLCPFLAVALCPPPAHADALLAGFRNPPAAARPLVWWHWMGGNVTRQGVDLDLAWMKRIGIGGVQMFDGSLGTPAIVQPNASFMSPPWKAAFAEAVHTAHSLNLEFAIASAPGWSETGGPWVPPAQAMKKLAWSQRQVAGGQRLHIALPRPPDTAGPLQDVPFDPNDASPQSGQPRLYRDIKVLAFPRPQPDALLPAPAITSNAGTLNAAAFADGAYAQRQLLPFPSNAQPIRIRFDFGAPVTVRAFTIGVPTGRGFGAADPPIVHLQSSTDGTQFTTFTDVPIDSSPQTTVSFGAITARYFSVVLARPSGPAFAPLIHGAPGTVPIRFGPPAAGFTLSKLAFAAAPRVDRFEDKAGFAAALNYDAIPAPPETPGAAVPLSKILDLTSHVSKDGTLDWQAPPGTWVVLRLGYSLTGHRNGPAAPAATGLEVDKLNSAAVAAYIDRYLGLYQSALGSASLANAGVTALLNDSIEAGPQNWTDDMLAQFQRRRGYDPTPFLPALTGTIVESAAVSDRFLYDFRTTIADLVAEAHYATLARIAHRHGLLTYGEALEDRRPQLGDDEQMRKFQNVPMGAMWFYPQGAAPAPSYVADDLGAASVAHLWGQNIAGAESFTMVGRPWATAPRDLQPIADLEFSLGINRIMIHDSTEQPFADRKPGFALAPFLGQYFTRNETWAEQAAPWITYLARNSFMLQQGRFVADVAYFYGEEAPLTGLFGLVPPADLPSGYGFDFINADALRNRLRPTPTGALIAPGGPTYRVLYLGGDSGKLTVPTLNRLADLVRHGVTLVGSAPSASRSLADDPAAFKTLVQDLWGTDAGSPAGHAYGKGRVFAGRSAANVLAARGIAPDFAIADPATRSQIAFVHRRASDADIYFVSNRAAAPQDVKAVVRIAGEPPMLWHAATGQISSVSYRPLGARTEIALTLPANGSVFIVFRPGQAVHPTIVPAPTETLLAALNGAWRLSFAPAAGPVPPSITTALGSWAQPAVPAAVRYFAGTGIYTTSITVPPAWLHTHAAIVLDLGDVRELAELRVNAHAAGIAWKPPFRLAITNLLHPGRNTLDIRVTNLWVNRLIGDAQPGVQPVTFTTGATYQPTAPLQPSGLLGPVRLLAVTGA